MLPPPAITRKFTGRFAIMAPLLLVALITRAWGNSVPITPDWPLPDTMSNEIGPGSTGPVVSWPQPMARRIVVRLSTLAVERDTRDMRPPLLGIGRSTAIEPFARGQ